MIISVVLEPCYEAGGDGFDYSIDNSLAHLALVDTSGHGLRAGLGAGVALSALRASRRAGGDLVAGGRAVDAAFAEQFGDSRLATAFLAALDLDTGLLSYVNAGHPPPLVVRAGRVVCRLDEGRRLPLGVADPRGARSEVATVRLERGDRLLCYTDGITEARRRDGAMFGEEQLVALVEHGGDAGLPAPEVLRRLSHAVLAHLDGPPTDDATLMLVEWSSAAARRILP
jgi:serine phosphatase RsbU (regulator of sigma subunit)